MKIWTYKRSFNYEGNEYHLHYDSMLTQCVSTLYENGVLIDQQKVDVANLRKVTHYVQPSGTQVKLAVSAGYFNWLNMGIEVYEGETLYYQSHPNKSIDFVETKLHKYQNFSGSANASGNDDAGNAVKPASQTWQKNKYAILADVSLGLCFYAVAKLTDDLRLAALVGVALGLLLVLVQRFVKVDLLGGFAVFGTAMLALSGLFSWYFNSEYMIQLKGTILGVVSACLLLGDGMFRGGQYFGPRFERYFSKPVDYANLTVGLGGVGLLMANINYLAATYLSKDDWLTFNTFFDTPITMTLFFIIVWRSSKKVGFRA